jgi:autotransporter-associated beta strand protein
MKNYPLMNSTLRLTNLAVHHPRPHPSRWWSGQTIVKTLILILALLASPVSSRATSLLEDTFSSATGNLVGTTPGVGSIWTEINPTTDKIQVTAGSLTAPAGLYPSIGNKISWGGPGEDANTTFANTTSGTVYYALLLQVNSTPSAGGTNVLSLGSSSSNLAASLALRRDPVDTAKYNVGFFSRQTTNGPLFSTTPLTTGTTHLVVISYTFVAGTNNDLIKLWLNPTSFGGTEPTPTLSLTNASGDVTSLNRLSLWQRDSGTPNLSIDELVVATSWAEVTPPSGTPPSITTQPAAQSVNSGGTAVFSVVADGDPLPAYQWRKDGTNISGATGATLTLANAAPADAGNYDVVITNTAGTVTSSAVSLSVYVGLSKANNANALNQTVSWSGGVIPTASQVARWDSTVTAARSPALGGNVSFKGIQVTNATGVQAINATTGSALTLGSQGIDLSTASTDLSISAVINLGEDQSWKVGAGRTLTIAPGNLISNTGTSTLSLAGPGKIRLGNGSAHFSTGTLQIGGGVDIGSINGTARNIANPVSLTGNFSSTSTSTTADGGLAFTGNISTGNMDRTVTLVSASGSASVAVFSLGGGTAKTLSGSGTLNLVNGNSDTRPTSVSVKSGITLQSPLRIGNAVTVFTGASNVVVSGSLLTVDAGGTFNMARGGGAAGSAYSQTVGALTGAGVVTSNATTTSTGTLTIDGGTKTTTSTFSGQITNTAGASLALVKSGLTTQVLTGNNTYSGSTKVNSGTLRLGNNSATANFLPASTALYLNTGIVVVDPEDPESEIIQNPEGNLDLSFANASIQQGVGSLFVDNVDLPKGIYGPVGSGAEFESTLITGTGLLRVGIITTQPAGAVANAGSNVTFTVSAVSGSSFQWRKNGNNIAGALSSSLTLTNVQLADSADYTVQVTNGATSQISAIAPLVINQAPSIVSQPVSVTTVDGVNTSLSVTVTGYPIPTFQWKKNGVNIAGATGSTLELNGLLTTDAGSYTVVITNSLGSVTSSAATLVINSQPNVVNVQMGSQIFSWTFNQAVTRGYYVDGQPWVIKPVGSPLYLTAASPSRENGRTGIYNHPAVPTTADINITVINPPFDHYFDGNDYIDNPNGVFGWDSRSGTWGGNASAKFNASLGWDGTTPKLVVAGDCITTPKSVIDLYDNDGSGPNAPKMPARGTPLDYLAVLTVVDTAPPSDAFRPGVIRPVTGLDRTNPEIIRYSDVIDLTPYLIPSPVGTTDLRGKPITAIPSKYTFPILKAVFNGPGFLNTGDSLSEGAHALLNNYAIPYGANYGGTVGEYMGQLSIGSLASWLTEEQRKSCRIRLIQRAIDSYSAIKAGLCVEESAGILPGYSTLITLAGTMLDHDGMKSVNNGVNGVKPWFVFADYACMFHTGDVPAGDLAAGETQADRGIPLYSATTTDYPRLNKKDIQPVAAASTDTLTAKTTFKWNDSSRPMGAILNMKVKVTGGAGAGDTIYVITHTITDPALLTDDEKFRKEDGTLFDPAISNNTYGFYYGGKVRIKPAWQNGLPNSSSVLAFSITSNDPANSQSDNASWYYQAGGVKPVTTPAKLDREGSNSTSPAAEYASVHSGGTIDNLIALYALGQEGLYKGAVDKFLIQASTRPGFGEILFSGSYLEALGTGSTGNFRGALWKQEVLTPLGKSFIYTGLGGAAFDVPNPTAKLWYEP